MVSIRNTKPENEQENEQQRPAKVMGVAVPSEKEFTLLLQDRAFVDYFNVFLALPVFGQRIMYRFHDGYFSLDPPVDKNIYRCERSRVVQFLRSERYPLFVASKLYLDYQLSIQLRNIQHELMFCYHEEELESGTFKHLLEFLVGHVIGMQYFRHSLLGTPGYEAYCCWLDLEKFHNIPIEHENKRQEQYRHIKNKYLISTGAQNLKKDKISLGLAGYVNFDVFPQDLRLDMNSKMKDMNLPVADDTFSLGDTEVFCALQQTLLTILKCYWLPRYVIHILSTTQPEVLQKILEKDWKLEPDGLSLRAQLLFEQLFPRHELELGVKFTPSSEVVTETSHGEVVEEEIPFSCPNSETIIKAGVTAEMFPSEALSRLQEFEAQDWSSSSSTSELSRAPSSASTSGIASATASRISGNHWLTDGSFADLDSVLEPRACTRYTAYATPYTTTDGQSPESPSSPYTTKYKRGKSAPIVCKKTLAGSRRDNVTEPDSQDSSIYFGASVVQNPIQNRSLCFYVHGNTNRDLSYYEKQNRHFVMALCSESLAGYPFRSFLDEEEYHRPLDSLQFWDGIREFLSTDNKWEVTRSSIAMRIADQYLVEGSPGVVRLGDELKRAVLCSLLYDVNTEALYCAQELMLRTLHPVWTNFSFNDRQIFLQHSAKKILFLKLHHWNDWLGYRAVILVVKLKKSSSYVLQMNIPQEHLRRTVLAGFAINHLQTFSQCWQPETQPSVFRQESKQDTTFLPNLSIDKEGDKVSFAGRQSVVLSSNETSRPRTAPPLLSVMSRPGSISGKDQRRDSTDKEGQQPSKVENIVRRNSTSSLRYRGDDDTDVEKDPLTTDHQSRAFELAATSTYPQALLGDYNLSDFYDLLRENYGSMAELKRKTIKQAFLRKLIFADRICVADLRVQRVFLYERPVVPTSGITFDPKTFLLKKDGEVIRRPTRPRTFKDILMDPVHLEYFMRFLMMKKAAAPLQFWKSVQQLRTIKSHRDRQTKITQIARTFFNKKDKEKNKLECTDDVIRQLPHLTIKTANIMFTAQTAIVRSLERKWFFEYLETFPEEIEPPPLEIPKTKESFTLLDISEAVEASCTDLPRRAKAQALTRLHWRRVARRMAQFLQGLAHPMILKLFDIYLRMQLKHRVENREKYGRRRSSVGAVYACGEHKEVMHGRLIILNKLPRDLAFWVETRRFRLLVDDLSLRPKAMQPITRADMDNVRNKISAIIECFLDSEVPPTIQINVPPETVNHVLVNAQDRSHIRGMFHEAGISIFPILYSYWRECVHEWNLLSLPETSLDRFYEVLCKQIYQDVPESPHESRSIPDYVNMSVTDCHKGVGYVDQDQIKICFTLLGGVRIVYPFTSSTALRDKRSATMDSNKSVNTLASTADTYSRSSMSSIASSRHFSSATRRRSSQIQGGRRLSAAFARNGNLFKADAWSDSDESSISVHEKKASVNNSFQSRTHIKQRGKHGQSRESAVINRDKQSLYNALGSGLLRKNLHD